MLHSLIKIVCQNFIKDDCAYRASALTFTSLLAIVPLMTVGFTILSAFPLFKEMIPTLENFIFDNFVPSTGEVVKTYLLDFTRQASNLSVFGLGFLFVTTVLLMFTVEKALNQIWRVRRPRRGVGAFLLYWAILSLTPILMGLSIIASSYVFSLPWLSDAHAIKTTTFLSYVPFLLSFISFSFLYVVVPNCKVQLRYGLIGVLFSSILFEVAKESFTWYLSHFHTYELLYGAFASIPIFFLWVYWVWVIVLLGAQLGYALQIALPYASKQGVDGFTHALYWLFLFFNAQKQKKALSLNCLLQKANINTQIEPQVMLNEFLHQRLITQTSDGFYVLSCNLNIVTLYHLYEMLPYKISGTPDLTNIPFKEALATCFKNHQLQLNQGLAQPLAELFSSHINN